MDASGLKKALQTRARELGFAASRICPAIPAAGFPNLKRWVKTGLAGEMEFFRNRLSAYEHPNSVLPNATTILMLIWPYDATASGPARAGEGHVSRYAQSRTDYHDEIHDRLRQLRRWVREQDPDIQTRGIVDTAPLLERDFARLSGLGWIGKNTMLLNREFGSWFFLAALLFDCNLPHDPPFESDHCGSCTACLNACPTGAFPSPYVLDATRCISYLTIEHRSSIDRDLRNGIGDWLFGCDICQEVCPWNRKASRPEKMGQSNDPALGQMQLAPLFEMDESAFRKRFRKSPIWRAHRRGLLRNAAIVLGNNPDDAALPTLIRSLDDSDPIVRSAVAWALGHFNDDEARKALHDRLQHENDVTVIEEIRHSIDRE